MKSIVEPERQTVFPNQLALGEIRLLKLVGTSEQSTSQWTATESLNLVSETYSFPPPEDAPYSFVAFSRNIDFEPSTDVYAVVNGVQCTISAGADRMIRNVRDAYSTGADPVSLLQNMNLFDTGAQTSKSTIPMIWLDELCINNDDIVEHAIHVSLSRDIFRYATETYIWIGNPKSWGGGQTLPGGEILDLTYSIAGSIAGFGKRIEAAGIWDLALDESLRWNEGILPERLPVKESLQRIMTGDGISAFPLDTISVVAREKHFQNPWIPAALLFAPRPMLVRGPVVVPADEFFACAAFCRFYVANGFQPLKRDSFLRRIKGTVKAASKNAQLVSQVGKLLRLQILPQSGHAAEQLGYIRQLRADVGRNTLWWMRQIKKNMYGQQNHAMTYEEVRSLSDAIKCVANDTNELGMDPTICGYALSQVMLLAFPTRAMILAGNLDVLSFTRAPATNTEPYRAYVEKYRDGFGTGGMPSWVPDWSKVMFPPWTLLAEDRVFHASASIPKSIPGKPNTQVTDALLLQAVPVGKVVSFGTAFRPFVSPLEANNFSAVLTLFRELKQFLGQAGKRYTDQQRAEGVWRIPARDMEPIDTHPLRPTWRRATADPTEAGYKQLCKLAEHPTKPKDQEAALADFKRMWYSDALVSLWDAKPAILDSGHVALVPILCAVGDSVYIPLGSHTTYAFRAIGDGGVKNLGHSFVYGAMDGEIKADVEDVVELEVA